MTRQSGRGDREGRRQKDLGFAAPHPAGEITICGGNAGLSAVKTAERVFRSTETRRARWRPNLRASFDEDFFKRLTVDFLGFQALGRLR